ncbi:hypothetical protein [Bizionia myxarmorum]|uniref:Uncharacterized protein n=1 Tax=Bizionia myxarmorum TaxID=291186 RepID=A0A5D0RCA6_9FLAO|nr:hypothetical protein [Bizionia myxarmorum]TYB78338.1 hypothetical protein ES674_00730 [Bizionia myxarmorum]
MGISIKPKNNGGGGATIEQDNINKTLYYTAAIPFNSISALTKINNGPAFGVSEIEEPLFKFVQVSLSPSSGLLNAKVFVYQLNNVGKGSYGTGNPPLTLNQIEETGQIGIEATDLTQLADTQIIDLGEIGATEIHTAFDAHTFIDAENPVQDQEDGYRVVNTLNNGDLVQYLFIGLGGEYGTTGTEITLKKEFVPFTELLPRKLSEFVDDIGATDAIIGNTIFIDTVNGNDDTAVIENRGKPFKTDFGAYAARVGLVGNWIYYYIDNNVTRIMNAPISGNNYFLKTDNGGVFDFSMNPTITNSPVYHLTVSGFFSIDTPFSNLLFHGVKNHVGSNKLNIIANKIELSGSANHPDHAVFQADELSKIECNTFNLNSISAIASFVGLIKVNKILNIQQMPRGFYKQLGTILSFSKDIEINEINVVGGASFASGGGGYNKIKINKISGFGVVEFSSYGVASTSFIIDFNKTVIDNSLDIVITYRCSNSDITVTGSISSYNKYIAYNGQAGRSFNYKFKNFTGKVGALNNTLGSCYIENSNIEFENSLMYVSEGTTLLPVVFKGVNSLTSNNPNQESIIEGAAIGSIVDVYGVLTTNIKSFGKNITAIQHNNTFKDKKNELVVRSRYELINRTLDTNTTYIVDGTITLLAGEFIEVPAGGNLTLNGYGLEASKIIKDVAGESIFSSPVGGSGGMQIDSLKLSTPQSGIFNLTDATGFNALEFIKVNFEDCASLGEMKGFRQGLWTNIGMFSCADGLTLTGTWLGGFRTKEVIVRNLTGTTGTLFKKGAGLDFKSRFYTDANIDIPTGWKIADFEAANFSNPKTFQLQNMIVTRAGVSNETDALYVPNITEESPKCDWAGNVGMPNSSIEFQKLRSPDNTVFKLTVDNAGVVTATSV